MKKFGLILIILCSIHFWKLLFLSEQFFKFTDLVSLIFLGLSFINTSAKSGLRFKGAIILFMTGIILNILSANINNSQAILDTTLNFGPFYFILIYFFLHEQQFNREELEKVIIVFAFLYAIFYLIQSNIFPTKLFNGAMYFDRGTLRIRIEGSGFLMLAYFLFLNRYLIKRKPIHVALAMFFFIILLKGGFRTLTAAAILLSGIVFLKLVKYSITNYFLVIIAVALFIGLMQLDGPSQIINGMINASEEQKEEGDRYIRALQIQYFTREYPENFSYYIFGGGLPGGEGSYAMNMRLIETLYGFFWVDLGLIGFYFVIGLIALLGLAWYTIRAIFTGLPPSSFYLNVYFAYLLLTSFTTMEIFRPGVFVAEAIGLYLIDIAREEKLQRTQLNNDNLNKLIPPI